MVDEFSFEIPKMFFILKHNKYIYNIRTISDIWDCYFEKKIEFTVNFWQKSYFFKNLPLNFLTFFESLYILLISKWLLGVKMYAESEFQVHIDRWLHTMTPWCSGSRKEVEKICLFFFNKKFVGFITLLWVIIIKWSIDYQHTKNPTRPWLFSEKRKITLY